MFMMTISESTCRCGNRRIVAVWKAMNRPHLYLDERHSHQSQEEHNIEVEEAIGKVEGPRLHSW